MKKKAETKKGQIDKEVREKSEFANLLSKLHLSVSLAPSFPKGESLVYRC